MEGFNYQKFKGECGLKSLIHALLILGIPVSKDEALKALKEKLCKIRIMGLSEKKIIHALKKFHLTVNAHDISGEDEAKKAIDKALDKGNPLIISCDGGDHWAVLAGKLDDNSYIYTDSSKGDLIGKSSWKEISSWMLLDSDDEDSEEECFYFIEAENGSSMKFQKDKLKELLKLNESDQTLMQYWGYYLSDLLDIFDHSSKSNGSISADEFFESYGENLLQAVNGSYYNSDSDELSYELKNYRTVAMMHDLKMPKESETYSLLKLTSYLTLLSAGIE